MSFGFTEILIIVALAIVFFGSGRLRNLGSDIGGFVKGLRSSLRETEELDDDGAGKRNADGESRVIEGEVGRDSDKTRS